MRYIESRLAHFYGLSLSVSAADYLLDDAALAALQAHQTKASATSPPRAAVWLSQTPTAAAEEEADDEAFIGIHFAPELQDVIHKRPPLTSLNLTNLDAFAVVVEEVSHFHLLCLRLLAQRPIGRLELEWQGDADKALIAGDLLTTQAGHPHLVPLIQKLYEEVTYLPSPDQALYGEANHYAAKFWLQVIGAGIGSRLPLDDARFIAFLRKNYQKPLEEKFPFATLASVR